jgi:uncharacterized membrane protein YfcA
MEYLVICLSALVASGLTLFSGFGLGTLLLPVFSLFFPVDVAVALTAIVHLLNNFFKLFLLGRHADKKTVIRFGFPAIAAALFGAWLLVSLSGLQPITTYHLSSHDFKVLPVKLIVSIMMVVFALVELTPRFEKISFDPKYLVFGGMLSGFFGGLSGHQGALRSAFLIRSGLPKESFIATGVVIACLIDFTRISVYSTHFSRLFISENIILLLAAVISAFLGAFIGNRLVKKVTMRSIQIIVSIMLIGIALGLGSGII